MRVTPHESLHQPKTVAMDAVRVQVDRPTMEYVEINIQRPDGGTTTLRVLSAGVDKVRMVFVGHTEDTLHADAEEIDANGQLIAVSTDLLEAAIDAVETFERNGIMGNPILLLRAAVRKAIGDPDWTGQPQ